MRTSLRNRLFALGTAGAAMLALSLAAPATANAAPAADAARTVRAQATVVVPDVVGENVGVAINELQALSFGLGFKQFKDNVCQYNKFEVVRQSPAAGSVVAVGSVVTLTFAVWPPLCP